MISVLLFCCILWQKDEGGQQKVHPYATRARESELHHLHLVYWTWTPFIHYHYTFIVIDYATEKYTILSQPTKLRYSTTSGSGYSQAHLNPSQSNKIDTKADLFCFWAIFIYFSGDHAQSMWHRMPFYMCRCGRIDSGPIAVAVNENEFLSLSWRTERRNRRRACLLLR